MDNTPAQFRPCMGGEGELPDPYAVFRRQAGSPQEEKQGKRPGKAIERGLFQVEEVLGPRESAHCLVKKGTGVDKIRDCGDIQRSDVRPAKAPQRKRPGCPGEP